VPLVSQLVQRLGRTSNTGCLRGKLHARPTATDAAVQGEQELAALWSSADEAPATCRAMREAAAAIESIFVEAPSRMGAAAGPARAPDPRDSVENWELDAPGGARADDEAESLQVCAAQGPARSCARLACRLRSGRRPAVTCAFLCSAKCS